MIYKDLRTFTAAETRAIIQQPEFEGAYITAWQAASLPAEVFRGDHRRFVVTVPDFLNYARLLNTGQALAVAMLPGGLGRSGIAGAIAGSKVLTKVLRLAKMDFWTVAEVLLRYDLELLPKHYVGAVCLHSHLTDFASVFENEKFVRKFFRLAGTSAGIHTQQLPMALSCVARWNLAPYLVSYLCATGDVDGAAAATAASGNPLFNGTLFVAEMDSWPADMQRQQIAEQSYHGLVLSGILVAALTV